MSNQILIDRLAKAAKDWLAEYEDHSLTGSDFTALLDAVKATGYAIDRGAVVPAFNVTAVSKAIAKRLVDEGYLGPTELVTLAHMSTVWMRIAAVLNEATGKAEETL